MPNTNSVIEDHRSLSDWSYIDNSTDEADEFSLPIDMVNKNGNFNALLKKGPAIF